MQFISAFDLRLAEGSTLAVCSARPPAWRQGGRSRWWSHWWGIREGENRETEEEEGRCVFPYSFRRWHCPADEDAGMFASKNTPVSPAHTACSRPQHRVGAHAILMTEQAPLQFLCSNVLDVQHHGQLPGAPVNACCPPAGFDFASLTISHQHLDGPFLSFKGILRSQEGRMRSPSAKTKV